MAGASAEGTRRIREMPAIRNRETCYITVAVRLGT